MSGAEGSLEQADGSLEDGAVRWYASLRRRGLTEGTIQTYGWGVNSLIEFAAVRQIYDFEDLRAPVLKAWQDQLIGRRLRPKTRSIAATAVRQFVTWAADEELVDLRLTRAVAVVRTKTGLPRPIPLADLDRIQAYIGALRPRMSERELRDRALFTFLLVSGARISEALQVQRDEFLSERPLIVRQKGGTEKELFVIPAVRERVLDYVRRRRDVLPALWVTAGRGPRQLLTRENVRHIWSRLARIVGVPRWTTHQLRHTCATELKRAGISDLVIAHHLGHHNLATLANYAAVVDEHRQQKLEVLQGLLARAAGDGIRFQAPARVRGRPDNRRRRMG